MTWYSLGEFSLHSSSNSPVSLTTQQQLEISDRLEADSLEKTTLKDGVWTIKVRPGTGMLYS